MGKRPKRIIAILKDRSQLENVNQDHTIYAGTTLPEEMEVELQGGPRVTKELFHYRLLQLDLPSIPHNHYTCESESTLLYEPISR